VIGTRPAHGSELQPSHAVGLSKLAGAVIRQSDDVAEDPVDRFRIALAFRYRGSGELVKFSYQVLELFVTGEVHQRKPFA